jgi:hypothetical protein
LASFGSGISLMELYHNTQLVVFVRAMNRIEKQGFTANFDNDSFTGVYGAHAR